VGVLDARPTDTTLVRQAGGYLLCYVPKSHFPPSTHRSCRQSWAPLRQGASLSASVSNMSCDQVTAALTAR
jgi:hypothetical protein